MCVLMWRWAPPWPHASLFGSKTYRTEEGTLNLWAREGEAGAAGSERAAPASKQTKEGDPKKKWKKKKISRNDTWWSTQRCTTHKNTTTSKRTSLLHSSAPPSDASLRLQLVFKHKRNTGRMTLQECNNKRQQTTRKIHHLAKEKKKILKSRRTNT